MLKSVCAGSICFVLGMATLAYAQNQAELNQESKSDYEIADAELNKVYKKLRVGMTDEEKSSLKEVQLLWLKYRDKNAEFAASRYEGGSIAGMVYAGSLTSDTEDRVERLKGFFREGYEE